MNMQVFIVGSGKLARELLTEMCLPAPLEQAAWPATPPAARAIVVHAGSGRELAEVVAFCERSGSPLLELSTGSALEAQAPRYPLVLCPNTNILMLKVMHMLSRCGGLFAGYAIGVTESHQASKTSVAGTAVDIAHSLGLAPAAISSVRDPAVQQGELGIEAAYLARHAFHRIEIADAACRVRLETRVTGDAPYAAGVAQIVAAVAAHPLEARRYAIDEFIANGWL
ncbi:dihydrodipicolinate reductase C-terminal domain-containing protein [Uliginosibacterium sp. 31-16]|uniref:dihydrodipicolinate reductase C-terminal domain-containing protein n=1 Tax=Uliginosibacterium sp. 31-16 TaxID=3068315 RepID=UPI00273E0211|nr:dihydrodipicolinate reductase C-terminal domain-containing protein [Uliginosibacterium sp. 31-16]MDP5241102.1 dihydrodipicolinate reductase C-terminal domain-containing protein [Uliginosibacterium sp. 31-16]